MKSRLNLSLSLSLLAFGLIYPVAAHAQVELVTTMTGLQAVTKGAQVTVAITVTNSGSAQATNVRSRIVLPNELRSGGGIAGASGCGSGPEGAGAGYTDCPLGNIAPGTSKKWSYSFSTAQGVAPATYPISISCKADQTEANLTNNKASAGLVLVAPPCTPAVGTKIALKADTGNYYARCNNCQQSVNNSCPDTITIHGTAPSGSAVFKVVDAGGGKVGLQADSGKFLARCNGCIPGAPADMLTVHATAPTPIIFERLASGKCALKADNGKYLGRCRGCSPGATTPDTVTITNTDPNVASTQVDVALIP